MKGVAIKEVDLKHEHLSVAEVTDYKGSIYNGKVSGSCNNMLEIKHNLSLFLVYLSDHSASYLAYLCNTSKSFLVSGHEEYSSKSFFGEYALTFRST